MPIKLSSLKTRKYRRLGDETIINLQDWLTNEYGLDLTGWSLKTARGISDDGLTIVGWGDDLQGDTQGWIVSLPEPTTLSLLALGGLALMKRKHR